MNNSYTVKLINELDNLRDRIIELEEEVKQLKDEAQSVEWLRVDE